MKAFRKFMKELGCWEQYKANVHREGATLKAIKECYYPNNYLTYLTFHYSKTPEGKKFWEDVEKRWCDHYQVEIPIGDTYKGFKCIKRETEFCSECAFRKKDKECAKVKCAMIERSDQEEVMFV